MEGERKKAAFGTTLVLPFFAAACAVAAVLLLLFSGPGSRLNLWNFRTGFTMIKAAGYIGLGCAIVALVSAIVTIRQRHFKGIFISLVALILALLAFGIPYYWKMQMGNYPRIHDISTDLNNPPRFQAISTERRAAVRYPGVVNAMQQMKAYPDIKTVILSMTADEAFKNALLTAREMGWAIVAERPAERSIEATDTTKWFGFKDDISIRITPAGDRSLLDIRSASRVGISDVGTNARRIRAFLAKMLPGQK